MTSWIQRQGDDDDDVSDNEDAAKAATEPCLPLLLANRDFTFR